MNCANCKQPLTAAQIARGNKFCSHACYAASKAGTGKGYITRRVKVAGKAKKALRYVHRLVYVAAYGEPPEGYEIHHIDFNKQNNRLSNLIALPSDEHKRLHAEYEAANDDSDYDMPF